MTYRYQKREKKKELKINRPIQNKKTNLVMTKIMRCPMINDISLKEYLDILNMKI